MNFFNFIKRFLLFTFKEIYSFFLKLLLTIFIFIVLGIGITTTFISKNKNLIIQENINENYSYVLFNPNNITEDKILNSSFLNNIINEKNTNISFSDIINSLEYMKKSKKIKGIIINLDEVDLSSAKIEELNKKFKEIKSDNFKIYAIGSNINNSNYTLASIADEIIVFPTHSANVSLTGYHYSNLYYKGLLNKLGVDMEVVRIGDYKSYGENYTSNTMSKELRSELTRIFENRYNNFISNISNNRNIDFNTLNQDILNGKNVNLSPFVARDKKLVDHLEYYSDFLTRKNISNDEVIDIYDYYSDNKNNIYDYLHRHNDTIAVLYAEGDILYDSMNDNSINITPANISKKIDALSKIPNLKGIVLRVNSGGGSALASEIIYQALKHINIPIYVSMAETAASGGYYISAAGQKIFADNATITGSIGVVSMFPKFYNAQNKYGFYSNTISKGKYANMYDSFTPISKESKNKIIESMTGTYNEFKSRVSEDRKIDEQTLENYAQGKIWLGNEAKEIKLIDGIASLDEVIKIMANDLKLDNHYNLEYVYSELDFTGTFKYLTSFILEKLNIISKFENIYNTNKLSNQIKLIESNGTKPMYYLPENIELY